MKIVDIKFQPIPIGRFYHPDDEKLQGPLYTEKQIESGLPYIKRINEVKPDDEQS